MLSPGPAPDSAPETMARGRKRKPNPTLNLPAHIDPQQLPKGIYWDRRWFTLEVQPNGRSKKVTVAHASALMSDLHAIAEARAGKVARGSLAFVVEQFEASLEFSELAGDTKRDYRYCGAVATAYQLRNGMTLGLIDVDRLNVPAIQRLVERIATGEPATPKNPGVPGRPSKANHVLRYLRRLFAWGIRMGHCTTNPAKGVRQAKEKGDDKMPSHEVWARMLAFAKAAAQLPPHSRGSVPPYLVPAMVLAHGCRLRGIELHALTDAHHLPDGILCDRVKGSRDNVTAWTPALKDAWAELAKRRARVWIEHGRAFELKADRRPLFVTETGGPLAKSSMESAWQRLMTRAIKEGVIPAEDRFTLHGLKHRGVTDTAGTRADKQDAAGHVTPEMTHRYDHSLPFVAAAELPESVENVLSGSSKIRHLREAEWKK